MIKEMPGSRAHPDDLERASRKPSGFVVCESCQDFRTNVTEGKEHPCPGCQPERFKAWRLADGAGFTVVLTSSGRRCWVILPPHSQDPVQPCSGEVGKCPCVFVQPHDGGPPEWVEVNDVEIVADGADHDA